jgi:hypothetical protein
MKEVSTTLRILLCFVVSCAVRLCQAQTTSAFLETPYYSSWAVPLSRATGLDLLRYSLVDGAVESRVQIEKSLFLYPDGVLRSTRTFPTKSKKIDDSEIAILLQRWDSVPSVLDVHVVPGTRSMLMRPANSDQYFSFNSASPFERPNTGHAPHIIARRLIDENPRVDVTMDDVGVKLSIPVWSMTMWLSKGTPEGSSWHVVQVDLVKSNGEWATRDKFSDFRPVAGYPTSLPFTHDIYEQSGETKYPDGRVEPAGPGCNKDGCCIPRLAGRSNPMSFVPKVLLDLSA